MFNLYFKKGNYLIGRKIILFYFFVCILFFSGFHSVKAATCIAGGGDLIINSFSVSGNNIIVIANLTVTECNNSCVYQEISTGNWLDGLFAPVDPVSDIQYQIDTGTWTNLTETTQWSQTAPAGPTECMSESEFNNQFTPARYEINTSVNQVPHNQTTGTHTFNLRARIDAQVVDQASAVFTVNAPPNIPTSIGPTGNIRVNPTFTAYVSDVNSGQTVQAIFHNSTSGVDYTGTSVANTGANSTITVTLADGSYSYYVYARDNLNAVSANSSTSNFTKDTVLPNADIQYTTGTITTTTIPLTLIESDDRTGVASGLVQYCTGSCATWTNVQSGTTNFNYTGTAGTTYRFRYTVTDGAGNTRTDTGGPVTVNTIPAIPTSIGPTGNIRVNPTFTAYVSDVNSGQTVRSIFYVNTVGSYSGSSVANTGGTSTVTATLADNTYTYYAYASDSEGSISANSSTYSFTKDTVAPTADIQYTTGTITTTTIPLTLVEADDRTGVASGLVEVSTNGGTSWSTVQSGTTNFNYTGTNGTTYIFRYTVTDGAGNTATDTGGSVTISLNTAPAIPTSIGPTGNIRVNPTFTAYVSDVNSGQTVQAIFHNSTSGVDYTGTSVANTGANSTITVTLADGSYGYYVYARDNLNAVSANSSTYNFTKDTVAPTADIQYTTGTITTTTIPLTLVEADDRTGVASGLVEVSTNGGTSWSTVQSGTTNFNYTGTNGTTYIFRYTVTDGAGNTATDTGGSVTVNTSIGVTFTGKVSTSGTYVEGPIMVNSGSSINLQWTATNATSCTASSNPVGTWSGSLAISSGTATIVNLTATTTFTITCLNGTNNVTDNFVVNINTIPAIPTSIGPTGNIRVNPTFTAYVSDSNSGQTVSSVFYVNSVGTYTGTSVANTGGTSTVTATLADGTYTYYAYAIDNLSAVSANSSTYNFTKDTVAPTADIQYTTGTITTTTIPLTLVEADDRTGVASGLVEVSTNGGTSWSTVQSGTTNFNYTGTNGTTYIFRYTVTDGAGNTATDTGGSVTININVGVTFTGKLSTETTYVDGPITVNSGSTINLQWTAASAVSCTASSTPVGLWSGSLTVPSGTANITNLTQGATFRIDCSNPPNSAYDTFVVDINNAPNMPTNISPTGNIRINPIFSATVSDANTSQTVHAHFQIVSGGNYAGASVAAAGGSSTITATLADGSYIYYAWSEDSLGLISGNSANYSFTKDTVAPTADIQYAEGTNTTGSIDLTLLEADDRTGVASGLVEVSTNGGTSWSTVQSGTTNFNYTGTNGTTYIFRYTVTDGAGNTATDTGGSVTINMPIQADIDAGPVGGPYNDGPYSTISGTTIGLNWTSSNATSCTRVSTPAHASWPSGGVAVSGNLNISMTVTTVFSITCTGPGGTQSDSVTVNVNSRPIATTLSMSNSDFCSSSPAYFFSWTYSDPDSDAQSLLEFQVDDSGSGFPSPEISRSTAVSYPSPSANNQAVTVLLSQQADHLTYNRTYYWRVRVTDVNSLDSGWTNGVPFSFNSPTHRSPSCNFAWSPAGPNPGETVVFTDTSSCYDTSGNVIPCTGWSWVFTDGDPATSNQQNPSIEFIDSGTKDVTFTVTDGFGSQCSITRQVVISLPLPTWKEIRPW